MMESADRSVQVCLIYTCIIDSRVIIVEHYYLIKTCFRSIVDCLVGKLILIETWEEANLSIMKPVPASFAQAKPI